VAIRSNVRFGSLADICVAISDVCFTPNSDRKSGLRQTVMSALPPIATVKGVLANGDVGFPLRADMCGARAHVCFGSKADMPHHGGANY